MKSKNYLLLLAFVDILSLNFVLVHCRGRRNKDRNLNTKDSRKSKLFPIIGFVSFPNDACNGTSSSLTGTCYSSEECEQKDGTNIGACASGYGVCCSFTLGCGSITAENNTYLTETASTTAPNPNPCIYTICKASSNICRIRLDFNTFNIAGPKTDSIVHTSTDTNTGGGLGDCLTDTFTFSSPGRESSPTICGFNTGQHMILDASESCNKAIFSIGSDGDTRQWDIKVTQYECGDERGGPPGCLQYFTGNSGRVSNFNYPTSLAVTDSPSATTTHLSSQKYSMCFRQESNKCAICFTTFDSGPAPIADHSATIMASFGLSVSPDAGASQAGVNAKCTTDFLIIPNGVTGILSSAGTIAFAGTGSNRFCGRIFHATEGSTTVETSVCTRTTPFQIKFISDRTEATTGTNPTALNSELSRAPGGTIGFSLNWALADCAST